MLLYHLDKSHGLQEGIKLNLKNVYPSIEGTNTDIKDSPFISLFLEGISNWGLSILDCNCSTIPAFFVGKSMSACINVGDLFEIKGGADSKLIEIVFELVRRLYFSHYPSRFQSIFAVGSIEEFIKWPELLQKNAHEVSLIDYDVYEISVPDNIPTFDSNWLKGGISAGIDKGRFYYGVKIDSFFDFAYHYWNRDFTEAPRLEYLVKLPIKVGRKISH